jgi:hypothetical protein
MSFDEADNDECSLNSHLESLRATYRSTKAYLSNNPELIVGRLGYMSTLNQSREAHNAIRRTMKLAGYSVSHIPEL